jgi:hypothetical protein
MYRFLLNGIVHSSVKGSQKMLNIKKRPRGDIILYGHGNWRTTIVLIPNVDNLSFIQDPYDFSRLEFVSFLKKHFAPYLQRANVNL